jgi:hypothetical protein
MNTKITYRLIMQNPTDITTNSIANTIDNIKIAPDLSPALVIGIGGLSTGSVGLSGGFRP